MLRFLFSFLDAKTFATSTVSTLSVSVLWVLGITRWVNLFCDIFALSQGFLITGNYWLYACMLMRVFWWCKLFFLKIYLKFHLVLYKSIIRILNVLMNDRPLIWWVNMHFLYLIKSYSFTTRQRICIFLISSHSLLYNLAPFYSCQTYYERNN